MQGKRPRLTCDSHPNGAGGLRDSNLAAGCGAKLGHGIRIAPRLSSGDGTGGIGKPEIRSDRDQTRQCRIMTMTNAARPKAVSTVVWPFSSARSRVSAERMRLDIGVECPFDDAGQRFGDISTGHDGVEQSSKRRGSNRAECVFHR